ncbi:MAG: methylenetetrahydrofolate reductase [Rhizobiales bacterium]|nr:methylenetetrahydrofolate reductase [Hyphomicrobiales bacterium]
MTTLQQKLERGDFVITAEIAPPLSASADALMDRAEPLRGLVDAINITDAATARAALSSLASAAILAGNGLEPIVQMTCRDRNRIAIACDLLGAAAQGVRNMLILHGDDPAGGDMPDAKPVFDLDSRGVMSMARDMRDKGTLPSGREIKPAPDYYIGCADAPMNPPDDWEPKGLEGKIEAGAQFAQTQFCYDLDIARNYFARLKQHGITGKLKFIAGIGPLLSAKQARFMDENLFGVNIPAHIIDRLDAAQDQKAEGREICAELIMGLREVDGIAGVHIMAPMQGAKAIAESIALTGLRARAQ